MLLQQTLLHTPPKRNVARQLESSPSCKNVAQQDTGHREALREHDIAPGHIRVQPRETAAWDSGAILRFGLLISLTF